MEYADDIEVYEVYNELSKKELNEKITRSESIQHTYTQFSDVVPDNKYVHYPTIDYLNKVVGTDTFKFFEPLVSMSGRFGKQFNITKVYHMDVLILDIDYMFKWINEEDN